MVKRQTESNIELKYEATFYGCHATLWDRHTQHLTADPHNTERQPHTVLNGCHTHKIKVPTHHTVNVKECQLCIHVVPIRFNFFLLEQVSYEISLINKCIRYVSSTCVTGSLLLWAVMRATPIKYWSHVMHHFLF